MRAPKVRDGFELGLIDPQIWTNQQVLKRQISFSGNSAEGAVAVVITVRDGDGGLDCNVPCQRAEFRLHGRKRPIHGEEVWQGFAFKVTGDIPSGGSVRTVIGQWKAPGDESPFLAQRFDDGVFHITVQDGPARRTVASAQGDPERMIEFQNLIAGWASDPALGWPAVQAARALAELKHAQRLRFGAALAPETRAHLDSIVTASKRAAEAAPDSVAALFSEFRFIRELERYAVRPAIRLADATPKRLPDPRQGWVDMVYRIKGGRTDNNVEPIQEGEVDIWANGEAIVEVRGNLGYRLTEAPHDPTMYFKFGMYRNILPGVICFHFDHFRQGGSRQDVM